MPLRCRLVAAACSFLAALLAPPTPAQQLCSETFHDPDSGDPTTLEVLLEEPPRGEILHGWAPDCPASVDVGGIASAVGIPPHFDFYIVIDRSGSTRNSAGMDVNGDGRYDWMDTILAGEVAAARQFVRSIDIRDHAVAIIAFDEVAAVWQDLTSNIVPVEAALDRVFAAGPDGGTNYGAALEVTLQEHLERNPTHRQVVVFLSDGAPTTNWPWPPGGYRCIGSAPACAGIVWSEEAGNRGLVVNTFAVGLGADPTTLAEMARRGHGQFFAIDVPGEIIDILPRVIHVGVSEILVRNETTGDEISVPPGPDGRFSAPIALVEGLNLLSATAVSDHREGWRVTCGTDATLTCITASCPAPRNLECEHDGIAHAAGLAAFADDPDVVISNDSPHDESDPGDFDASGWYPLGDTLVTFTFEHPAAGAHRCSTLVGVRDTTRPELHGVPEDQRVACEAPPRVDPVATDACDPDPSMSFDETRIDGGCPYSFDLVRRWIVRDASGNSSEATQVIEVRDDEAPEILGVPPDDVVACDAVPPPPVLRAADACDPDVTPVLDERRRDGACADTYTLTRTWTAIDACGHATTASQIIEVQDVEAPLLHGVPADMAIPCRQPMPPPAPVAAVDSCDPAPVVALVERREEGPCPGRWRLIRTWTATDRCVLATSASQVIDVTDDTPPTIVPDAQDRHCLWPPRHDLVTLTAADFHPVVTDDCSGPARWAFVACRSSQPDDGLGDGHSAGDCRVSADGQSLLVRAERSGQGGHDHVGRTYVPAIVAWDACGNASAATDIGVIHVPHDMKDREARCRR